MAFSLVMGFAVLCVAQAVAPAVPVQAAAQAALAAGVAAAKTSFLSQVSSMSAAQVSQLVALYVAFNAFMSVLQKTLQGLGAVSPVGQPSPTSLKQKILSWALLAVRVFGSNL